MLFGSGAAILGCALYSAVRIATGWNIGYIAIGVAWLVCTAMRKAAPDCGGRKFQIIAALLTYSAVSLSAIPEAIHAWSQHKVQAANSDEASVTVSASPGPQHREPTGMLQALVILVVLGLASPFIGLASSNPLNGLLGLFLMFIAVRYAWRTMAADLEVHGPFPMSAAT